MEFCNKRTKNIVSQGVAMAEISEWWITTGWGILSYGPQTANILSSSIGGG